MNTDFLSVADKNLSIFFLFSMYLTVLGFLKIMRLYNFYNQEKKFFCFILGQDYRVHSFYAI